MGGMTIIENLRIQIHGCKVAFSDKRSNDLCRYLDQVVLPRLGSYAVFIDLLQGLPAEHSLRDDEIVGQIIEDQRQLLELAVYAEEYRT
jgi:hypothetical protein